MLEGLKFNQPERQFEVENRELNELLKLKRSDLESLDLSQLEKIYQDVTAKLNGFNEGRSFPESTKAAFNSMFGLGLPGRRKKHVENNLHAFAVEYVVGKIKELELKHRESLTRARAEEQKEMLAAEQKEQEKIRLELREKIKAAQEKALAEWNSRKKKLREYSPRDLAHLADAKRGIKKRELQMTPEELAFRKEVARYENLLGFVFDEARPFGPESFVVPAEEFDDIVGGVDFAVKIKSELPPLTVDLTHSLDETPDKLFDHFTMPLKKLAYPTAPAVADTSGLPVVVGGTFHDIKELVDDYFQEKITEVHHKPIDQYAIRMITMILPQLRDQQEIFNRSPQDLGPIGVTLKQANEIYNSVLEELENKKESLPDIDIDDSDPWIRKLTHPLETVREKYPDV